VIFTCGGITGDWLMIATGWNKTIQPKPLCIEDQVMMLHGCYTTCVLQIF